MDIQGHLENTYHMLKQHAVVLLLSGLVVQILVTMSLGLLIGPLVGTYILMMVCLLRDGKSPNFNDVFNGLARFGELFSYFFICLIILFGFFLLFIPGLLFLTWWIYVLILMADRRYGIGQAMTVSRAMVRKKGLVLHLAVVLFITVIPPMIINTAAAALPFLALLQILIFPAQCGFLASLYLEQFEGLDPATARQRLIRTMPPIPPDEQPPSI